MTKTELQRLAVEVKGDARGPALRRLVKAAWRRGVHFAWTADGEVVAGGPNTPAARSAVEALLPYAELLRKSGLVALAEQAVPPMASVEAACDYVVHAVESDRADRGAGFLEMLRTGSVRSLSPDTDGERGQ